MADEGVRAPIDTPQLVADGDRIEYRRGALTEWYVNAPEGLEQGFTLAAPPAGEKRGETIALELAVRGELRAALAPDGAALDFLSPAGAALIHYGALKTLDAAGRELPSRMELTESAEGRQTLRILVDARGAAYPLTIDPLATSAAWTAEGDQSLANFAQSVAAAGDVNGDGFGDVIVGAPGYDQSTRGGCAMVYLGSAAGLSTAPAWMVKGEQANARFGASVAAAGDVNGDGYGDVIVGAPDYGNGQSYEGRAYVYLGSPTGLAATPAWTVESNKSLAQLGVSVASAGDVNGDGFSDVIVGTPYYTNDHDCEGCAWLYLGSATGLSVTPAWIAEGDKDWAYYGCSVASAGDVNSDGYGDIIVGSNYFSNEQIQEGRALLYLGAATGLTVTPAWTAEGDQANANYGCSVAAAGDVNGDGYGDIIIGAGNYKNDQTGEGRAYVYLGSAAGLAANPAWTAEGNQINALFGASVAGAGDVNGDGYGDIIVGAYYFNKTFDGRAWLYLGSATGLSVTPAWTADGNESGALFGAPVAGAGDINGDGFSDVIVGAPGFDNGQIDEGRAFVYLGAPSLLAPDPDWTVNGVENNECLGRCVATAGDVNGDGYADVIFGSYDYDHGLNNQGRALLHLGSASGLKPTSDWMVEGGQANAQLGYAAASAGDVNGDGYGDVIVGAPGYSNGQYSYAGRAQLHLGSATGLSPTPAWTAEGDKYLANFGYAVASAGDVNGDGYGDVLVGAASYPGNARNRGRAYLYLGSAAGISPTPVWTAEGDEYDSGLGRALAGAGDVNGDGFDDVIISEDGYKDGAGASMGRVLVYLGSAAGLSATPAWSMTGNSGGIFNASVASAGDVNGDGYADVLAGAPDYDRVTTSAGRVSLFYGNGEAGRGLATPAGQYRSYALTPISALGLGDTTNTLRIRMLARTPFGRGKVRLEAEVKPFGAPFSGTGVTHTAWTDTGRSGAVLTANIARIPATPSGRYHWRARLAYQPASSPAALRASRWVTPAANGLQEADVRLPALLPGALAAAPASLAYLEGTSWAVDVERGGAPTTQSLTLSNTGETTLTFTHGSAATPGLALAGPAAASFRIDKVTPATAAPLAPGARVTVVIRFAPAVAARTLGLGASLLVTSDSPVTPLLTIPLTGDAVPVKLSDFTVE